MPYFHEEKIKMKKTASLALAILMLVSLLAGCGGGEASSQAASSAPVREAPSRERSSNLTITFSNASSYIFHEIYISPTASSDWGEELLGSTRILKSNGSIDVEIPAYDYDNYDILVVDEDSDEYYFSRVPLQTGSEVAIYFGDDGLAADVADSRGNSVATIFGTLEGASGGGSYDNGGNDGGDTGQTQQPAPTGTGYDTNGQYTFTVYNESAYDIYAIHMGVVGASADYDIDILPQILSAGNSTDLSGMASQGDWLNTEWTLYITDVDGDTSSSYEVFNPWTLTYVDINWDSNNGGYVCEFVY